MSDCDRWLIKVGSRRDFATWAAGAVASLGLLNLALLVVAIAKGTSGWLIASFALLSVAFIFSSVSVYRITSRERP